MSIKTLTFWLDGVTKEQDAMLREILRRLGDAQREATKAWLKLACEKVKPAGTSQTCSWCGHREPGNRVQSRFRCLKCGYMRHADLNAANNIARDLRAFGPCGHSDSADELRFDGVGLQQALNLPTGSARSLRSARQEPPTLGI